VETRFQDLRRRLERLKTGECLQGPSPRPVFFVGKVEVLVWRGSLWG
jgi:hypothetical protein